MGVQIPVVRRLQSSMMDGFRFACIAIASTEGVTFSTSAIAELFDMMDRAELSENVSADELLDAQLALVRLVHEAAITAQSEGELYISPSILRDVRRKLCPLPPWIQPPC